MSKTGGSQRLFRAVRLLPEVVRVGTSFEAPQEEPGDSPGAPRPEEDPRDQELRLLLEEIQRSKAEVEDLQGALRASVLREEEARRALEELRRQSAQQEKILREELAEELRRQEQEARTRGQEEGRQAGYTEGQNRALREVEATYRARYSDLVQLLENVHQELQESLEQLSEQSQSRLVRLWENILGKLLMREVDLNEATAMILLRQVLSRVSNRERLVVYLHPADVGAIQESQSELGEVLRGVRHLEFVADEQIDRGSCLVETNLGVYDARWRTQLEQIGREIDGILLEEETEHDENQQ